MKITTGIAVLLLAAVPALAEEPINADRPGLAESSSTVGAEVLQVEAGVGVDITHAGGSTARDAGAPLLIRYGLSSSLEARVETDGYQRSSFAGETESGLAPVSAGVKWNFMQADEKTNRPSMGLLARLYPPSGTGEFKSETWAGDLRLAADIDLAPKWSINPNIGVARAEDENHHAFTTATYALTLSREVTDTLELAVDGGAEPSGEAGGGTTLLLDLCAAWRISNDTALDATVGWGARGEEAPNVFYQFGVSHRF